MTQLCTPVIPAEAGIQSIERSTQSGTAFLFCLLRRISFSLDSRLPPAFARVTGNDEVFFPGYI